MSEAIAKELESLCKRTGGVLKPADVVAFAEDPKTALHEHFEWDDVGAAIEYRIWQARQIIRAVVTVLPDSNETHRVYVSLKEDRYIAGGGYRVLAFVLSDEDRRKALLEEAWADFGVWEAKYKELVDLAAVFEAARGIKGRKK